MTLEEFYSKFEEALKTGKYKPTILYESMIRLVEQYSNKSYDIYCPITCVAKELTGIYHESTWAFEERYFGPESIGIETNLAAQIATAADSIFTEENYKEIRQRLIEICGLKDKENDS